MLLAAARVVDFVRIDLPESMYGPTKADVCARRGVIAMPDITISTAPSSIAPSSSPKGRLTISSSTPIAPAIRLARSTSRPSIWPPRPRTLNGGWVADMPTRSVPLWTMRSRTGDSCAPTVALAASRLVPSARPRTRFRSLANSISFACRVPLRAFSLAPSKRERHRPRLPPAGSYRRHRPASNALDCGSAAGAGRHAGLQSESEIATA